ncbi:small nuclear ribonucleoprotein [Metabacillus sp. FJAT-53654]|uniref:Small nuclear ribonucleoprotein n=1 Tax=Metabacillus rhizosphaerae TaxID=3117747 RepID=A0ABZ2MYD4_9BACI
MSVEGYNYYDDTDFTRNIHGKCKSYMYHHVVLTMQDGSSFDGIIEGVDDNGVSVLVGEDAMEQERDDFEDQRYGGYGGYGGPRRRFRRFRRQFFPIAALAALSLLPYAYPYPYPYYPPYYPYY